MVEVVLPSAAAARAHPALWAIYASEGAWIPFAWLRWLCDEITGFLDGPERFLAVSVPPGHGKSEFLSKYLPTFLLGTRPGFRVIQASYAASLTVEWARVSKELLALHGREVFDVQVSPRAAADSWDVFRYDELGRAKRSGYLRAAGRGGPITGKRAELFVIDDILKDDEEAQSASVREKVWQWIVKVAMTRLTKTGKMLLVGTRWHHDDPIGRLEDRQRRGQDKDGWRIVRLPALAEAGDPMGRAPGEALCPELFPAAELERIKARDARAWVSLYQGRPTPANGAIYKRETFRYASVFADTVRVDGKEIPLDELSLFVVGDLAVSGKRSADYSALGTFGADLGRGHLYWLGLLRARLDGPGLLEALKRLSNGRLPVYVEKTAYHLHMIQVAIADGTPVRMLEADRDKVSRAHPAAALLEAGRLWLAEGAPWLAEAEAEILQFPAGKHDDVADVLAYAARVFNEMGRAYEIGAMAPLQSNPPPRRLDRYGRPFHVGQR